MEKYKKLSSLYYEDKELYESLYQNRFNSECSYRLPFYIHGEQSFYVNTLEITNKIISILKLNDNIIEVSKQMPQASAFFFKKILVDEIMLTNDIEGIHSSRNEIELTLNNDKKVNDKLLRFYGMGKKYQKLINGEKFALNKSIDVRQIYDDIVYPEIENENKPDGKIFRKNSVSVYSATDKEKHKGVLPESKIISCIDELLDFINNVAEVPMLIKICIFHYMFGYIHPFYDGNGRMDRFITSYLLKNELCDLVGLRISYTIKNCKNNYYKAFDIGNDKKNRGDLTYFILMFLDVILNSSQNILELYKEANKRLSYFEKLLGSINKLINYTQANLIYLLLQNTLFGNGNGLNIVDISEIMEISTRKVRDTINEVLSEKLNPIYRIREKRKYYYYIDLEKFEEYVQNKLNENSK